MKYKPYVSSQYHNDHDKRARHGRAHEEQQGILALLSPKLQYTIRPCWREETEEVTQFLKHTRLTAIVMRLMPAGLVATSFLPLPRVAARSQKMNTNRKQTMALPMRIRRKEGLATADIFLRAKAGWECKPTAARALCRCLDGCGGLVPAASRRFGAGRLCRRAEACPRATEHSEFTRRMHEGRSRIGDCRWTLLFLHGVRQNASGACCRHDHKRRCGTDTLHTIAAAAWEEILTGI